MERMWKKLREGKPALGTMMTGGPQIIDYIGQADFDFIIPDMMFTAIDWNDLSHLTRGAHSNDMGCIVRLQSYPFTGARADDRIVVDAARALSLRVDGVTFAVRNAEEARQCAALTGNWHRNVAPTSADMVKGVEDEWVKRTLVMPSIESEGSIENIEEIIDVEGITGIFIAWHDFTRSLGYPLQIEHPEVLKKADEIVSRARKKGLIVMANTGFLFPDYDANAGRIKRMGEMGIQLIMVQLVEFVVFTMFKEIGNRVNALDARVKKF